MPVKRGRGRPRGVIQEAFASKRKHKRSGYKAESFDRGAACRIQKKAETKNKKFFETWGKRWSTRKITGRKWCRRKVAKAAADRAPDR